MPVIYGGISIRPAPYVTITKENQFLGDGRWVCTTVTASLRGTITATKTGDVETPLTIEKRLSAIVQKQSDIRETFGTNGLWLEIQGLDGTQSEKFIATVDNIEFQEGPWVDKCDYMITLHGENLAGEEGVENNHIESATESWQFEEGDGPHTYRVVHTLQAKGKTVFNSNKSAWEYAKDFVTSKLRLDWATINTNWSPKSGNDIFLSSNISPEEGLQPYNRVVTENVDELDGQYSATENFFLSKDPWWEEYTVTVRKETDSPRTGTVVGINGVIHGLATGLHNPEGRLANAQSRWNTVKTLLLSRATSYAPTGVTLNPKNTVQNVDVNINEGTISYQYEWNDRQLVNYTYEFYNVSVQASLEDTKTTVTIDGTITGEIFPDDPYNPQLRYDRAVAQWKLVQPVVFARAKAESGIIDLQPFPVSASVTPNKQDGTVSYSFTFDNRIPDKVRNEYTVSTRFNREDGRTTVSIEGTVTGLRFSNPSTPFGVNSINERYDNAKDYFSVIAGNLVGLAANYVDINAINPTPFGVTVSHIPNAGQITYQYEYNSNPRPCVTGALSENITITDEAATPVIAIIPVLGRDRGPVIQNIGTVKEKRRTVTIEVVMRSDYTITNMCEATGAPLVDIALYAPRGNPVYLEQDQTQWSPGTGHYTRTVSWIYE